MLLVSSFPNDHGRHECVLTSVCSADNYWERSLESNGVIMHAMILQVIYSPPLAPLLAIYVPSAYAQQRSEERERKLTSTTFQPPVNSLSNSDSNLVTTIAYLHCSTSSSDPTTTFPVLADRKRSCSWVAKVMTNTGMLFSSILP